MGNTATKIPPSVPKVCFTIERVVAGNCNFLANHTEQNIRVGIVPTKNDDPNPLARQAIKIGDSDPYRLKSFDEGVDTITYHFEKNVDLTLMKRRGSVTFRLKTPDLDITEEVDPRIAKGYKTIDMAAEELDKIQKIYRME